MASVLFRARRRELARATESILMTVASLSRLLSIPPYPCSWRLGWRLSAADSGKESTINHYCIASRSLKSTHCSGTLLKSLQHGEFSLRYPLSHRTSASRQPVHGHPNPQQVLLASSTLESTAASTVCQPHPLLRSLR